MADPEVFVDRFSDQVETWRDWHVQFREHMLSDLNSSQIPGVLVKLLGDFDELLKTQEQVNVMMLAVLDELKKGRET